jgi:endonuclease YncB( thermonuclease family)
MGRILTLAVVSVSLFSAFLLHAADPVVKERFDAKVIGVTDGDTLRVLRDRKAVVIRLEGIDAPEKGQEYGSKI